MIPMRRARVVRVLLEFDRRKKARSELKELKERVPVRLRTGNRIIFTGANARFAISIRASGIGSTRYPDPVG